MSDHMKYHDHSKSAHPDKRAGYHEKHLRTGYEIPAGTFHEERAVKPSTEDEATAHSNRQPNRSSHRRNLK